MHEMSLAENILQLVESGARRAEALKFCFASVSRGSMADGAVLEINHVAGLGHCAHCGREVPMRELYDACPACDAHPLRPLAGTEMRVREIEIVS